MYENEVYLIKDLKQKAISCGVSEIIDLVVYESKVYTDDFSIYAQLLKKLTKHIHDKKNFANVVSEECDRSLSIIATRIGAC